MFGKISQILGNAWDAGKNIMGSLKDKVGSGFDMLKNGAMKAGKFVYDNHEAIGNIVGGLGNILNNMPNSPVKQKMEQGLGATTTAINKFSNLRPSNQQRQQFNNNIINKQNIVPNNAPNIPMRQNIPQINNQFSNNTANTRLQFKMPSVI